MAGASTDDIYAAMDWLEDRQDAIEAGLARRHLCPEANPARMALFDLSSSWLKGTPCPQPLQDLLVPGVFQVQVAWMALCRSAGGGKFWSVSPARPARCCWRPMPPGRA